LFNALLQIHAGERDTRMPLPLFLTLLPSLLGLTASAQPDQVRTMVVQEEVIMRIPVRTRLSPPAFDWVERKGPKCVDADEIRAAALRDRTHVDFLMVERVRIRAQLADDCPALDFYNGFYLTPNNGKVCVGRESIHSRMGGSCRIERFRRLVPRPRQ
jgi:hypothetical protein